jgi:hypothetical protein
VRQGRALALLLLATGIAAASAQPAAWRCDGDTPLYTDRPCSGGRAVEAVGEPSARQRSQALEVTRREQALATALRAERLGREAEAARARGAPPGIRMPATEVRAEPRGRQADSRRRNIRPAAHRQQPATAPLRQPAPAPARLSRQTVEGTAPAG